MPLAASRSGDADGSAAQLSKLIDDVATRAAALQMKHVAQHLPPVAVQRTNCGTVPCLASANNRSKACYICEYNDSIALERCGCGNVR